jgi:hypothetical protein
LGKTEYNKSNFTFIKFHSKVWKEVRKQGEEMLNRFYRWYDNLQEPKRFLCAMSLIGTTVIVPISLGNVSGWLPIIGFFIGGFWLATRKNYLDRNKSRKGA